VGSSGFTPGELCLVATPWDIFAWPGPELMAQGTHGMEPSLFPSKHNVLKLDRAPIDGGIGPSRQL
jgi:hypothetical protein